MKSSSAGRASRFSAIPLAFLGLIPPAAGQVALRPDPRPVTARFAVIGDYGGATAGEAAVAARITAWDPEFVVTVGDNNYPNGAQSTIDDNIGQFYSAFIHPYVGAYGPGASVNRFFPTLGNHDWVTPGAGPYLGYFTLPGNERYYELVRGPIHFFMVDSDVHEPDGNTSTSVQAQWLRSRLALSRSPFDVVVLHHAPYSSSSDHGSQVDLQWPFRAWGADAVLCGHDHDYERVVRDGFPYLVDGLGGFSQYNFGPEPVSGSVARFRADYGALLVEADEERALFRFVTQADVVVDTFSLPAGGVEFQEVPLVRPGAVWKYLDDGSNQGIAWRATGFDDSGWSSGPAQLGYGDGDEATVVGFGPDPNNRYITTWFRRSFPVADPAAFRSLSLELVRDDGAIVYLNGVEVHRSNMAYSTVGYLSPAETQVADPNEDAYWGRDLPPSALVAGTNVLAVEVHQFSGQSSDVSFDLRLTGVLQGTALSPAGATWSYLDNGVDPGPLWTGPLFDDSAWASGPAQLGYGDGDEATVVGFGSDPNNKYPTTWFRRSFQVANPAAFSALLLRVLRDDGVAVHLNGVEIYRSNLPRTGLTSASTAGFDVILAEESAFLETFADARLLLPGTNVLAVEVHQINGQSPDLSFDLELTGL